MPSPKALSHADLVASRFGARATGYDEHAQLQRATAAQLADFLQRKGGLPYSGRVLEIGCGTGLLTGLLAGQAASYLATDIAPAMLERCRLKHGGTPGLDFAVLDGEQGAPSDTFSAIVSNLAAQWFQEPVAGLARLAGQTRLLAFALPLRGSFPEWEQAFQALGRTSGLLPLPDRAALDQALGSLPGRSYLCEVHSHSIRYANAQAFADSFRKIGADQPRAGYRPGPIRQVLQRFTAGMDATALVLYGLVRQEGA